MNKMRKLSALVCAGALAVIAVAPAWADTLTSGDIAGEGGVENMGESGVSIDKIVLPAVADGAYDFSVDPEKLLRKYGGADNYADTTLFFNAEKDAAKFEGTANAGDKVFYEDKVEETTLANAFAVAADGKITVNSDYFVWVPDRSSEEAIQKGDGTWVTLTDTNYATYFTVPTTGSAGSFAIGTVAAKGNKELDLTATTPNVCDGKLYTLGWKEVPVDKVEDYVTFGTPAADGTVPVTAIKSGVKLATGANAAGASAISDTTTLKYTAATRTNKGESDTVKIVNKSSTNKTVRVKVNVTNPNGGLNFVAGSGTTDPTSLDNTKASLFLKVTGADNTSASTATKAAYVEKQTVGTGDAAVDYYSAVLDLDVDGLNLEATPSPVTAYMAGIDDKTKGHIFNAFLSPVDDTSYKAVSFKLAGKADDINAYSGADAAKKPIAQKAWNDYAASLRASSTVINPGITVVYEIKDRVTKIAGTPTATTGEASWDGGYIWFDLGSGVDATDANQVQIVNKTGVIEDVYKVDLSKCSLDGSWVGLPSGQEAGDTSTVLVELKTGNKVYSQKLW